MYRTTPRFWLILGALACLAHLWVNYPSLPERVATHFGTDGRADGWMTKAAYARFQVGLTGFLALLFLGIGKLMTLLPDDAINLPNRDYWLAPARRARTVAIMKSEMHRFGCAMVAFSLGIQEAVIRANISQSFRLGSLFFVCLVGFLGFTTVWTIGFYRRFRR
jgi:uncharacterized membrane protein